MTDIQKAMREEFEKIHPSISWSDNPKFETVRQTEFTNGWQAATAQSAEKIARLEDEKRGIIEHHNELLDAARSESKFFQARDAKKLAAAELSNKQLRATLDEALSDFKFIERVSHSSNFKASILKIEYMLAQQPSTEALDAYVAKFNPWISVNLKLPENRQEVLAREKDGCIYELRFIQERDESCTYSSWYDDDGNRYGDVAHWMPLPPAPEQKG